MKCLGGSRSGRPCIVEKRIGKQVKTLRIANELEFCNASFDEFYKKGGIVRHHTIRHTPQHN